MEVDVRTCWKTAASRRAKDVRRQTNRRKRRRGSSQGHRNGHEKRIACRPNQDGVKSQGLSRAFGVRVLAKCSHAKYCVPTCLDSGRRRYVLHVRRLCCFPVNCPFRPGPGRTSGGTSNCNPKGTERVWAIFRHQPPPADSKEGLSQDLTNPWVRLRVVRGRKV